MRNNLFYRTLFLCCLLLSGFAQAQLPKIYLHPKAAGSGKQSQFIDSIRFIPLEIKEGIELGEYNNIEITNKYFLVRDYYGKRVLVYTHNGSFVKNISYKKLGDFYPAYNGQKDQITFFGTNKNYALTEKDQLKIMVDLDNPRNKKYFKKYTIDLKDTLFSIKKAELNKSDMIHASPLYGDLYLQSTILTSPEFKDSLDHEIKLFRNNQLVKAYFPYNRINEARYLFTGGSVSITRTNTPDVHYVTRPFCDTIYKMVKDSLFPVYQLVMPLENSLPPTFFTRPFKNRIERDNFNRNNGWLLHQVHSFVETSRFIYFSVGYLSNYESYILNKQTNITYKARNMKADTSQYNLQLLGSYNYQQKEDRFYIPLKASELIAFFEKNKNVAVPRELESFLKSNPSAASPIIVAYKLKN